MRKAESRTLHTCAEVMEALGGATRVSMLTGAKYKTVWPWAEGPTFPSRYFLVMGWALKKMRLKASPALWGMVVTAEMEKEAA